jgi:chromosome segregation ATPase
MEEARTVFELIGLLMSAFVTGFLSYSASRHKANERVSSIQRDLEAALEAKGRELLSLLETEKALRAAAENKLSEIEAQRERDIVTNAREMAALYTMTQQQDKDIQGLREKVSFLESERNRLKAERDNAQQVQEAMAARLETATERLSKAEAKIAEMSVENRAFELLFSRLRIVVDNHTEGNQGGKENVPIG